MGELRRRVGEVPGAVAATWRLRRGLIPARYAQTVRERVARPGRRMRRVCTGTLVQYEQAVRNEWSGPASRCASNAAAFFVHPPHRKAGMI